jgi:predicted metal-dependent phosphotriesterase family hydrolase
MIVPTVLGDVPAAELGRTNVHEHLLMRDPLLAGEELDDEDRAAAEVQHLCASGFDALLELTPLGLGRDPAGLAAIARRTGAHIVMATGVHHEGHYPPGHRLRALTDSELAERFTADLVHGTDAGVRAGVIKVGIGYWSISEFERTVLEAAAAAHAASSAPVVCHLERGTAAFELLELLTSRGVPPDRILLAHIDRNPDPGLHAELAQAGAYLGYDGWSRTRYWPDSALIDCLMSVTERGAADRIVLGTDLARRSSFASYGGLPGLSYLGRRVIPRLRERGGDELIDTLLVRNPARLLCRPARPPANPP